MPTRNKLTFYYDLAHVAKEKIEHLQHLATEHGFVLVDELTEANIIVSVGSDGTFLQAVRKSGFREDCLYAGISTTGSLGVYCDFLLEDTGKMIEAATKEEVEVRRYPVIQVDIDTNPPFYCLNEVAIRSNIIRTFVLDVFIDDIHFETFRGDGMIVSTPTGSTAYNKSVNGAVLDPMLACFQVSELASINNNRYRTLGSSFVLSGNRTLRFRFDDGMNTHPIIAVDNEALGIRHVQEMRVTLPEKRIKTIKLKDNSFWEKVKRTFL